MKKLFSIKGTSDYLIQVSLIILSLIIATGINRCNEKRKDVRKLDFYLESIEKELTDELKSNRMNLGDAKNDIKDIKTAISLSRSADPDSLQKSLRHGMAVYVRGVFRTFESSTFDLMAQTSDILLINDLAYRNQLAYVSAFRDDYLKKDLIRHDEMTFSTAEQLSKYIDLACAQEHRASLQCLTDTDGYRNDAANIWILLARETQLRIFHLELAVENTVEVLEVTRMKRSNL